MLTQFLQGLSSFFQLEIFAITGYVLSSDGGLIGDRRVVFRAFERDQMLFHVVRERFLWSDVLPLEDRVDSLIRSQIYLAAALDCPAWLMMP
jgi:hypothetical protein